MFNIQHIFTKHLRSQENQIYIHAFYQDIRVTRVDVREIDRRKY